MQVNAGSVGSFISKSRVEITSISWASATGSPVSSQTVTTQGFVWRLAKLNPPAGQVPLATYGPLPFFPRGSQTPRSCDGVDSQVGMALRHCTISHVVARSSFTQLLSRSPLGIGIRVRSSARHDPRPGVQIATKLLDGHEPHFPAVRILGMDRSCPASPPF